MSSRWRFSLVVIAIGASACVKVSAEYYDAADACRARDEYVAAIAAGPDDGATWEQRESLVMQFKDKSTAAGDDELVEIADSLVSAEARARSAAESGNINSPEWDEAWEDIGKYDQAALDRCSEVAADR